MRRGAASAKWAVAGLVLAAAGCLPAFGPVHVRIDTGGVRYDDFVIQSSKEYGRLHSSTSVDVERRVVPSEEDLELSIGGPTFATVRVWATHPEFLPAWTAGKPRGVLPAVKPERWSDRLKAGEVDADYVKRYLESIRDQYVPAFPSGAARQRLQRYLPGLGNLVARARGGRRDGDGLPGLEALVQEISRSMQ